MELNHRPPRYKRGALTAELCALNTIYIISNRRLCQLVYSSDYAFLAKNLSNKRLILLSALFPTISLNSKVQAVY